MADGSPPLSRGPNAAPPALHAQMLVLWLSPAFPVGAFAFSHGLERLAQSGEVSGRDDLVAWVRDLASHGSLRNDLIVMAQARRAVLAADMARLDAIAELASALQPSSERRLETLTQGGAFAATISAAWPSPATAHLQTAHDGAIAYPVAVGAATADHSIALEPALAAYACAFASNLVSAAIRLGIIGQFDGQRVLADLIADLARAATAASAATLDDLGSAVFLSDIASMEHETQYTRLFRS
jgi:urease accessory protein